MGIPASCQQILNTIGSLEAQIAKIQSSPDYIQGPKDPHPGRPDPELLAEVKALEKKIKPDRSAFNSCLLKNVKPFPVKMTVNSIHSIKGTSEVGSDEPYVFVTVADLSTGLPGLESTLYGPVSMNEGETKSFPGKPFWFIDHASGKAIADLTKVIIIVSLMENDNGSPSAARGLVKGEAAVSLAGSSALPRADRVQKLIADINSALGIPTGFPNADDQIGSSQELALSSLDLILPILGPHAVSMTFAGDGQFTVNCLITQA
jgi:hypothetical protein